MAIYTVTRSNVALSTTADTLTIITPASRRIKIHEVQVAGMGTTSTAGELVISRSTGGVTGGGAVTPQPTVSDSAAAASVVNTTWATQPTLAAQPLVRLGVNANGGINRWVAKPSLEIEARNAEQISLRSAVGTFNVTVTVIFEEF